MFFFDFLLEKVENSTMNANKMKWNKFDFFVFIIILIPIVMIIALYNKLSNELGTHFGTSGEPDDYQGKVSFLLTNSLLPIGIPLDQH